jgi:transposase
MENIALIGIDLGKNSFHIHCQDRRGKAVYRKKFTRPKLIEFLATCPATTIAMEACGGSHFMARKLEELGHSPKLISPQFVRPFVKSNKNDFVDAEAICEAASRPSMRFVQPRTESQQAMRALHRVRESLVQDKVKTTNQMHAFLLEFGISVPRGAAVISRLSTLLGCTKRIDGRDAASQIASASTKSFLLLLTNGRTNCGDISFGECPNSSNLRAIK